MSRKNLRELRSGVKSLLGQEMDGVIPPAEVDAALFKAMTQLNKRFEIFQTMWTATNTANKTLYQLPTDLIKIDRAEYEDNKMGFLDEKKILDMGDDLDVQTPAWTEVVT